MASYREAIVVRIDLVVIFVMGGGSMRYVNSSAYGVPWIPRALRDLESGVGLNSLGISQCSSGKRSSTFGALEVLSLVRIMLVYLVE